VDAVSVATIRRLRDAASVFVLFDDGVTAVALDHALSVGTLVPWDDHEAHGIRADRFVLGAVNFSQTWQSSSPHSHRK
jgi:hypothetical protein